MSTLSENGLILTISIASQMTKLSSIAYTICQNFIPKNITKLITLTRSSHTSSKAIRFMTQIQEQLSKKFIKRKELYQND